MHRNRLNLLLLAIALALGAAAWMAHRHQNQPKGTLTPLAAEGVAKILIEWPGSPTIELEKKGAEWFLKQPVVARADRFEATGATSLASTAVQEKIDSEGVDLKELGLDPPDHVVTLNDVRVEFGGSEPLQSRRYTRVNGAIQLIEDPATAALDKDYADLVSKELFATGDALAKIELPGLTLTRAADGQWQAPAGTPDATPAALKTLAEGWQSARAMWCEAAEGAAPAGEPVRITTADGRVSEFIVAATEPQLALYAPALKVRYQLSQALADTLLKLPKPAPAAAAAPEAKP